MTVSCLAVETIISEKLFTFSHTELILQDKEHIAHGMDNFYDAFCHILELYSPWSQLTFIIWKPS